MDTKSPKKKEGAQRLLMKQNLEKAAILEK